MAIQVLIYNLDDERKEARCSTDGLEISLAIFEIDQNLRNIIKHGNESSEFKKGLEKAREMILRELEDRNLQYVLL